MFTALFNMSNGMSLQSAFLLLVFAAVCGLIIAATALLTGPCSRHFSGSLVVLPMIIQVVILMVNGNIGTGVAVMGAFGLVRFRSAQGSAREIVLVFLAMAVGLATGMAYATYALFVTLIICLVMVLISRIDLSEKLQPLHLRISIPEDLDEMGLFDDILSKYTRKATFEGIKSIGMGTVFEMNYQIIMKDNRQQKAMMDEIRVRNGNLTVALSHNTPTHQSL